MHSSPRDHGHQNTRWSLALLLESCPWLNLTTCAGLSQVLTRLEISYKRARDYVHSPDPNYQEKLSDVQQVLLQAYYAPEQFVALYLDELTFFRQPSLARAYELCGHIQPLARRSHSANNMSRIVGAVDVMTGRLLFRQHSKIGVHALTNFWTDICAAYPSAQTIYVILDNWPVHFHPTVLAPLAAQTTRWPLACPDSWLSKSGRRPKQTNLPIQLVPLPIYASWLNPIEKVWRKLNQEVLHLHCLSEQWNLLKQEVDAFLRQFADGSLPLLRSIGLLPN